MTKVRKNGLDPLGGTALTNIIDTSQRPRRVVFVGVDAGRYDYLERFDVPNINRIIERGVSFRNSVCGSFISETSPGFASLSTGVYAKSHGVCTSRSWFDRESGEFHYFYDEKTGELRLEAPTLADIWKSSDPKIKVAAISTKDRPSMLLAGREADVVAYSYNELTSMRALGVHYKGAGVNEEHYVWKERPGRTTPAYLDDIRIPRKTDWIGNGIRHLGVDIADIPEIDVHIMDAALAMFDAEQPDLFFITLVSVNIVGHLYGTNSPEIRESVEETDRQIGRLLEYLESRGWLDETLIVVVSDHGMTDRPNSVDVMSHLANSPDVAANVAYYLSGSSGGIYLHDTSTKAVERAVAAIREIPNIRDAWYRDDSEAPWFIRRFAHPHCPDILILADYSYQLVEKGWAKPSVPAHHGPPYLSDINVWSIFSGPGVKPLGVIGDPLDLTSHEVLDEDFEAQLPKQVDVHPTIRAICGF